ncbi:hypothetical protein Syun_000679 [Stephania yunnanensis]|uniref:NmrA-like domain-containing protein n=1 Tax=Stephania yunnanensis TaxID=152371 RepID=A0AAP0LGE8_9MAGN
MYSDRIAEVGKRSVKERLDGKTDEGVVRAGQINGKRFDFALRFLLDLFLLLKNLMGLALRFLSDLFLLLKNLMGLIGCLCSFVEIVAITGDSIVLKFEKARSALEESLKRVEDIVPQAIGCQVLVIVNELQRTIFTLDPLGNQFGDDTIMRLAAQCNKKDFELKEIEIDKLRLEHIKLVEENDGLHLEKQKLAEEASYAKRFVASEYGNDVDRTRAVDPAKFVFGKKAQIRRRIEPEGIPYIYICNDFCSGSAFNKEEDIAAYLIKAVDAPRTLNKTIYVKPPNNVDSINDLVSLWEKKIGKTLERVYLTEEQVSQHIEDGTRAEKKFYSIGHSIFIKRDQTYFEIEPSFGVEASELYPEVKYTTLDEFLNQFI